MRTNHLHLLPVTLQPGLSVQAPSGWPGQPLIAGVDVESSQEVTCRFSQEGMGNCMGVYEAAREKVNQEFPPELKHSRLLCPL